MISKEQPVTEKNDVLNMVHVVFDGPPSHESGRFVECEAPDGRSVSVGEWHERDDGYWELRIPITPRPTASAEKNDVLTPREIAERIVADARKRLVAGKPEYDSVDLGESLIRAALSASPVQELVERLEDARTYLRDEGQHRAIDQIRILDRIDATLAKVRDQ